MEKKNLLKNSDSVKQINSILAALAVCVLLAACSSGGGKDQVYPISLDGTEIIVGETKMETLYDAGYTIVIHGEKFTELIEIEATAELEADAYYSQLYNGLSPYWAIPQAA